MRRFWKNCLGLLMCLGIASTHLPELQAQESLYSAPPAVAGGLPFFLGLGTAGGPQVRNERFWMSTEYLLWWTEGMDTPPLVTGGTQESFGILGEPGTVVLFGGEAVDFEAQSGGRFSAGFWFDPQHIWGVEGSYFFLDNSTAGFSATSDMDPLLARPFFDIEQHVQNVQQVSNLPPFPIKGGISVDVRTRLSGGDVNVVGNFWDNGTFRLDGLLGIRYLRLTESLSVREDLLDPDFNINFIVEDRFETRNEFWGGQIGARSTYKVGIVDVSLLGKVAIGQTWQQVGVEGSTTTSIDGGPPTIGGGGLLAQVTNIGVRDRDRFAVVPEVTVTLGLQPTERIRLTVGYTFLYITDVARPGDQIDFRVNPELLPPALPLTNEAVPAAKFLSDDFWAHGVNFGFEFRF